MSYILGNNNGQPSITCTDCGMTSYNPNDIKHKYCGNCHKWHDDTTERQQGLEETIEKQQQEYGLEDRQ